MTFFDNMDQFELFWQKELNQTKKYLDKNNPIAITGMYGVGYNLFTKKYLLKYILNSKILNLESPTKISSEIFYDRITKLLKINVERNAHNLYFELRNYLEKQKEEFTLIIRGGEQLLNIDKEILKVLDDCRYKYSDIFKLVIIGDLSIANYPSIEFKQLIRNSYIYLKQFDKKTTFFCYKQIANQEYLKESENFIWKYSNGHRGIIKFLILSMSKSPYENLNKKYLKSICKKFNISFWIEKILRNLTHPQLEILCALINNKKLTQKQLASFDYKVLRKAGIIKEYNSLSILTFKNYNPEILEIIKSLKENKATISNTERLKFTNKNPLYKTLLTSTEKLIFDELLKSKNNIVTYSKIGKLMWGDDSNKKFSLWAISKTISRIREKDHLLGFSKNNIKSVRGKGYMWVD